MERGDTELRLRTVGAAAELFAIAAVAYIVIPNALRLTHYTGVILHNIYIDLRYLGLTGTIRRRSDLTPRK